MPVRTLNPHCFLCIVKMCLINFSLPISEQAVHPFSFASIFCKQSINQLEHFRSMWQGDITHQNWSPANKGLYIKWLHYWIPLGKELNVCTVQQLTSCLYLQVNAFFPCFGTHMALYNILQRNPQDPSVFGVPGWML